MIGLDTLVAERARREAQAAQQAAQSDAAALSATLAAELRKFYYPKQAAFFTSKAELRATKKTRRSGATAGGCRELVARSIEGPDHRATYITGTLKDARKRAWCNDTKSGFVDVIRRYGKRLDKRGQMEQWLLGSVVATINKADLVIDFSNGSQIDLFGADQEGMADRLRGIAKSVFWIDEAQDLTDLQGLYKDVIVAAMQDFGGECWLTGTPGKDCVGLFYEVTTDDEQPLTGWEVHRIASTDNPMFGRVVWERGEWFVEDNLFDRPGRDRSTHPWTSAHARGEIGKSEHRWGPFDDEGDAEAAAIKIRWERSAGAAIRKNGWKEDDPSLLREYFARWVKADARYVYALHTVPEHEIVYAPVRLGEDGFPDLRAALADLPGRKEGREYFLALGADLGTRAAFAFVIWAWSLKDPILYELASWKKPGLDYDEMAAYLHAVRGQVTISLWTADAGGGGKPAVMGWSKKWVDRYHLPIIEATKQNKRIAQNQLNTDIRKGLLKLRKDSVIMTEWRVHRWKPLRTEDGKEVEDSTPHDASDGGLYAHRESYHHRYRPEPEKPIPGSPEHVIREVQELEAANCEQDDLQDPYQLYAAGR